jgi:hypothetical protein
MNDLEHDLRDLFDTRARDASVSPTPSHTIVRRARRRQVATVATSVVLGGALVIASIAGISALTSSKRGSRPVGVPEGEPGQRSVVLPRATLTYPSDWYLLDLGGQGAPRLQLSNFDPGLEPIDCDGDPSKVPSGGVVLSVAAGSVEWVDQPMRWPVDLEGIGDSGCEAAHAAWQTPEGDDLIATASLAPDASAPDRDALADAFASLVTSNEPMSEDLFGDANLILDSRQTPAGPIAVYAYRADGSSWIGIAGPAGSRLSGAGQVDPDVPLADENVTMILDAWGGVVWGDVSGAATRAALSTVEGRTYPAKLLPLPSSLGTDHQAVFGVIEGSTADRVTTLLYDAEGNVLNDFFPTGARVTIATGTDPEGGPWDLYLDTTNDGVGLGFGFTNHGGGSGCCLRPLKEDFQLDGWGTGSEEPSNITALASEAIKRIVFEAATGERIEGGLYPVPDASLGIPQVGLVIVPSDVTLEGQLVAYGASGDELAREDVGDNPEPAAPTTEIDIVWDRLRRARTTVQEYAVQHHGSLEGFDALEATKIDPGIGADPGIRWNDGQLADGEVSIRGAEPAGGTAETGLSGWTAVIVSATVAADGSPGSIYCIAINIDENGGGNFRYGTQDAATYEECRGGWPELGP